MNMNLDLIRAWKDEDYRESLSAEQLALLNENPAGLIELTDEELGEVEGAVLPLTVTIALSAAGGAAVSATVAISVKYCWVIF